MLRDRDYQSQSIDFLIREAVEDALKTTVTFISKVQRPTNDYRLTL